MTGQGVEGCAVAFLQHLEILLAGLEKNFGIPSDSVAADNLFLCDRQICRDQRDPVLAVGAVSDENDTDGNSGYNVPLLLLNQVDLYGQEILRPPGTLPVHGIDSFEIELLIPVFVVHFTGLFEHGEDIQ